MKIDKLNQDLLIWPNTYAIDLDGALNLGGQNTIALAQKWGTPLYIFDEITIRQQCKSYINALSKFYPGHFSVHYASKAFANTAIASLINDEGLEFDVVSAGELALALRAGVEANSIHFHGNAKTNAELKRALDLNVGAIVIDNLDEINTLEVLLNNTQKIQKVLIRVAPNIGTNTHPHIQTGHRSSKFGVPLEYLEAAIEKIITIPKLKLVGLHFHLGSQIEDAQPYTDSLNILLDLYSSIKEKYNISLSEISPGGGLGVNYNDGDQPILINDFVKIISKALVDGCTQRNLKLPKIILEPGRSIIARSCVCLYSIIATKNIPEFNGEEPIKYVHIDGGMGDNIRPALYDAVYSARLANRFDQERTEIVNVSGRYCESGDVLLKNISLPSNVGTGDIVAVAGVGAYTLSMASSYNMVPRPAVLLAGTEEVYQIQRRETEEELFARDIPLN